MINFLLFTLFVTLGYLSGSVCSAVIVSRLFNLPDPREEGSQNPGATNVLRLAGPKYAMIVLVADMLKGFLPVLIAHLSEMGLTISSVTCLAAVFGHMYPVFYRFKGGKGVATALGGLFGLNLILGVSTIAIWLVIFNFFRYSSLASIIAMLAAPLLSLMTLQKEDAFIALFFMTLFILYQHRDNVTRLLDGTEPKSSFRSKTKR